MDRLTTKTPTKEPREIDARKHGFTKILDHEKFDLRKCGSDAADKHAVRYFTGLMMDKMIDANGAGSVPWYVPSDESKTNAFIEKLLTDSLHEGDLVSVANYAMMLHIRKELKK